MEKFRWAYVGCGGIARITAKQIISSDRHEIISVCSRNIENAKKFARKFGGQAYDNIAEAVSRADVDGVYICSTNNAHYANALEAIEAGKPVLLEKPVTLTAVEAEKLFAAAEARGVYLAEAMWTWFNPVANKVKEWVNDGRIGRIKTIDLSLELNLLLLNKRNNRLLSAELGGGALLDLGVYPITYCYRLLGKPQSVECEFRTLGGVDAGEKITMHYENTTCTMRVALDKLRREQAYIVGESGKIVIPRFHATKKAVLTAANMEVFRGNCGYVCEFDAVADEIRAGLTESRFVPKQATLDVMHIMDKLR